MMAVESLAKDFSRHFSLDDIEVFMKYFWLGSAKLFVV